MILTTVWQKYDNRQHEIIADCIAHNRRMTSAEWEELTGIVTDCQHPGTPILEGYGQGDDEHHRFICPACGAVLPNPESTGQVTELGI